MERKVGNYTISEQYNYETGYSDICIYEDGDYLCTFSPNDSDTFDEITEDELTDIIEDDSRHFDFTDPFYDACY